MHHNAILLAPNLPERVPEVLPATGFDATLKSISGLLNQLKTAHDERVASLEKCILKFQQKLEARQFARAKDGAPTSKVQVLEQDQQNESDAEEVQVSSKWEPLQTHGKPSFVLKEGWSKVAHAETFAQDVNDELGNLSMLAMRTRATVVNPAVASAALAAEALKRDEHKHWILRILFIDPSSMYRMFWDISGMVLIAYDMVAIPIQIAFEPDPMWFVSGMGWLTLVFWTLDMAASCITGYFQDGELISSHKLILKAYVKLWFWADCIIVIPDWVLKTSEGGNSPVGLARMLRIARSLRILRLLRLLKLKKLSALIYDNLDSEFSFLVFGLLQMVGIIMVLTHFVACIFFLIGRVTMESGADRNWLKDVGLTPAYDQGLDWKYLTSLHWSITQFTPASMDIYATNVPERLFSVVILYIALVALSSFIGSISASVTQIRNMSADANKSLWLLRRYLKQKQISIGLTQRILSYMDFQLLSKQHIVLPGQVKLLAQLSEQLKSEMAFETTIKFIKNHPLFSYMNEHQTFAKTMYSLCSLGFRGCAVAEEETLFNLGDQGFDMIFVKNGGLEYTLPNGETLNGTLKPKNWVAEGVLWTAWTHRGWLRATEPSDVLKLSPKTFSDIMHLHPKPAYLGKHYGANFVKYLNRQELRDLTDVIFDAEVWINVVLESDKFVLTQKEGVNLK